MTNSKIETGQTNILLNNPWRLCAGTIFCALVILLFFRAFPTLDNAFSALFFNSQSGVNDFVFSQNEGLRFVRQLGLKVPIALGILTAIWMLVIWVRFKNAPTTFGNKARLLIPTHGFLSVLIGPALITEIILKPLWGRPRPTNTLEFGGDAPYIFPGEISNYCTSNCSFVSGEATGAFWMLWIVPFLPKKWIKIGGIGIFCIATAISLLRVAFGKHFLSDVILAALVALFAIGLSAALLQSRRVQQWIAWEETRHR